MTDDQIPNRDELEERAYRCRTIALSVRHMGTRQELMRIADDYDVMAQRFGKTNNSGNETPML